MFGVRFWALSAAYTTGTALVIGVPTVLIPNSFFMRMTPTGPLDYLIWIVSVLLMGPLLAMMTLYPTGAAHGSPASVRASAATSIASGEQLAGAQATAATASAVPDGGWRTLIGGIFSYFSVGCPVCNKIVLLLLGTSGAMTIFNPLRPFLGAAAVILLAVTLYLRVRVLRKGCPV